MQNVMKKFQCLFNLLILVQIFYVLNTDCSFAQWNLTNTEILSAGYGKYLNIINPETDSSEIVFTGLVNGTVDDNPSFFYSVSFSRPLLIPDTCYTDITDSSGVIQRNVLSVLNNYYPYKASYQGMLENLDNEAAAIQLAIWKFSFNVNLNTVNNQIIRDRAGEIISETISDTDNYYLPATAEIVMDNDPEFFLVKTTDENGNLISVTDISLSLSYSPGHLSTNSVNTLNGYSQPVQVIGSGIGIIEARGNFIFPPGMLFGSGSYNCRKLFLAKPVAGLMSVNYDWGTLPVEISFFNFRLAEHDVRLQWGTASELNNSGFEIERYSSQNSWEKIGFVRGNGTSNESHTYNFVDKNLFPGTYKYRLKQTDYNGNSSYIILNEEINIGNPGLFGLSQNYPNPFNPSTVINYTLKKDGFVSIIIFDAAGKEVRNIVNDYKTEGSYSVNFSADFLAAGIYFCKMEAEGISKVIRMALIK